MITYEQAFTDHAYLWKIAPADDMTGAYVDQDDLDKLLDSPTKLTARKCLTDQIVYWFQVGPDPFDANSTPQWHIDNDPNVAEIYARYEHLI